MPHACICAKTRSMSYKYLTEPPGELRCLICLEVARDPLKHDNICGKLFCRECLKNYGEDIPCPNCEEKGSHFYEDTECRQSIQNLGVKCRYEQCKWEGTLGSLEDHLTTCIFVPLPCPKECKDDNGDIRQLLRTDLAAHLENCPYRDYKCNYCEMRGTYYDITEVHIKTCVKKPVPCPSSGCTEMVERGVIDQHISSECAYTVLTCKYSTLGCKVRVQRSHMPAHEEDDKSHLHMLMTTTAQLLTDNTQLKKDVSKLKEDNTNLMQQLLVMDELKHTMKYNTITLKLTNFHMHKKYNKVFKSQPFYTHPHGYHMALMVYANGQGNCKDTHVSAFVHIVQGNYDPELTWPLVGEVTIELLNQIEDKSHHGKIVCLTKACNAQVGISWGASKFIPHSQLGYSSLSNTLYLKDDTLYIRMSVEVANHTTWLEWDAEL